MPASKLTGVPSAYGNKVTLIVNYYLSPNRPRVGTRLAMHWGKTYSHPGKTAHIPKKEREGREEVTLETLAHKRSDHDSNDQRLPVSRGPW